MSIDPNNPVIKLCAEGVKEEMAGRIKEAASLYREAWEKRTNDYESCVAAHYLARVQKTPKDRLYWNQEALNYAHKIDDQSVEEFFPSLYLNLGKVYEDLGNKDEAKKYYTLAADKASKLPNNKLGNMTRDGIKRGLERVG